MENTTEKIKCFGGYLGLLKDIAHGVQTHSAQSIKLTARLLRCIVPTDCVIVPMPGHDGYADGMKMVCYELQDLSDRVMCNCLTCTPHESVYEQKKRGETPSSVDMKCDVEALNEILYEYSIPKSEVYIIDSVVDTGTTAKAALQAMPFATIIALAKTH